MSGLAKRACASLLAALGAAGCSLGNIGPDACDGDTVCVDTFGLGSRCDGGFCTDPTPCATGHDCRRLFDGGACVEAACRATLPPNDACRLYEPPDLAGRRLVGPNAPLVVGNLASVGVVPDSTDEPDTLFDRALSAAARLAVREINGISGLNEGRPLAMVTCDNGGFNNTAADEARKALNRAAIDYLSGVLGAPVVVGPTTSTDSLTSINHILDRKYPTAFISPSATSPQLSDTNDRLDPGDPVGLFWRTPPSDELQGAAIAKSVVGTYPMPAMISNVAVLYVDDAYGLGLATVFQKAFPSPSKLYPFKKTDDFVGLAATVAADAPDAVLMVAILAANAVSFIDGMTQSGLATLPFYLTDGSKDKALLDPSLPGPIKDVIVKNTVGTAPGTKPSPEFDAFSAALKKEFGVNATQYSFLAHAYDASYCGAYGVLHASLAGSDWDGRGVAIGLSRLVDTKPPSGAAQVKIGKNTWEAAKNGLTTGAQRIDVVGVSGALDFDVVVGEASGFIEIWRPKSDLSDFDVLDFVDPAAGGM
jgi:ABC-type branched-subunit amino acid transport system substrate-binding protein